MSAAAWIGLAAGALQALAYGVYILQVLRREGRPNGMTWAMWAYGTFVIFAIEVHIGVPVSLLILPAVCMLCSIGVAAYAFSTGVYIPPERQDWAALALDASLMGGYVAAVLTAAPETGLAFVALAGVSPMISSWPILRTTYIEPGNERPLAWLIWSAAYGLLTLAIMSEGMAWPYLVYPALSHVVNLMIGIFALQSLDALSAENRTP